MICEYCLEIHQQESCEVVANLWVGNANGRRDSVGGDNAKVYFPLLSPLYYSPWRKMEHARKHLPQLVTHV